MTDKLDIAEVINRYFAALDNRTLDVETFSKIFMDNATVERPNGTTMTGPEEIGLSHEKSFERFKATQHLTSGFIIDLAGKTNANFRVNLVAMHLWNEGMRDADASPQDNYFLAGGVISGTVTKISNGWRILSLRNDITWRQGTGFQQMVNTE